MGPPAAKSDASPSSPSKGKAAASDSKSKADSVEITDRASSKDLSYTTHLTPSQTAPFVTT